MSDERPDSYMQSFKAVKAELCSRFGPDDGRVFTSPIPLYVDPQRGLAGSLTFPEHVPGYTYCTCGLSLHPDQQPGRNGHYELMMCAREEAPHIPEFIGALARYTFQAVLKPGDTMDIGSAQPAGSTVRGLLCAEPDIVRPTFTVFGRTCTMLLLLGITEAEMEGCLGSGSEMVLSLLKQRGEFPYTTLSRESVVSKRHRPRSTHESEESDHDPA